MEMMTERGPLKPVPNEPAATENVRRVSLTSILGSDREILIDFNGANYRLRITRNQKLILTK